MKNTYIAKTIILSAVVLLGLSSCQKENLSPNKENTTNSSNAIKLSDDELLRKVSFDLPAQIVKTSVQDSTLKMDYTEDISTFLDPNGFDLSFSIRLNEYFTASALAGFNYTLPAPNNTYTYNWAGNDLKVLNEVTKSTVNVGGKNMVKLHLVRYFTFTKTYPTAQQAINQQNILLNTKTDVVKFTGFVVFGKEYPSTTMSALLTYTK